MFTTTNDAGKTRPADAQRFQFADGTIISTRSSKPRWRKLAKRLATKRGEAVMLSSEGPVDG